MARGSVLHDNSGIIASEPARGTLLAWGTVVPVANTLGYAPGCEFIKADATSIGTTRFVNIGTKTASNFVAAGLVGAIAVNFVYGDATPIDTPMFVADRAYAIVSVICRPVVAGTDAGAVTAQVRKAASGTAMASGTVVHSGTINLKGTIDTNQVVTLISGATSVVASGNAIGLDVTGTTTAARGVVTVLLLPS